MSYILEALRKVEQQREQLHAYGLSSRLRYYGAVSVASRPRTLIVVAAAATGALLSGVLSAYLTTDSKSALPLQQIAVVQTVPAVQQPEQTFYIPDASENVQHIVSDEDMRRMSSLQTPRAASLQTSVPSHPAPAKETVVQAGHREKAKLSRSDKKTTSQENKLSIQQLESASSRSVEVTTVQNASRASDVKERILLPEIISERPVHGNDVSVEIGTPLSSNEQPSRSDEVIRPPQEKNRTTPEEPMVLSMLPPQIQSIVPKMSIDGVVYSLDPKQRIVVINTKLYNEGQSTPDGVTIEAIQQTDIICSYQGQRFRLSR